VTRERCRIADPFPPPPENPGADLGSVVADVMKRIGLTADHWLNTLEEEWTDLVGATVAKHTRPGRFERKRLTVYVDSSVWLHELSRTGRHLMLANLEKRYGPGKITSVSFHLDPGH
jgi:predicted nucleic acid-binding Zn ribbon protein